MSRLVFSRKPTRFAAARIAGTLMPGRGATVGTNDNWTATLAPTFTQVGAFPLTAGSRDAALLLTVPAGGTYTIQVSGVNNTTGEALVEVYEGF